MLIAKRSNQGNTPRRTSKIWANKSADEDIWNMRRYGGYQQGLFDDEIPEDEENDYDYKYGIPFKTRNMPILPATNIDDTYIFGLMRISEKIDNYTGGSWIRLVL